MSIIQDFIKNIPAIKANMKRVDEDELWLGEHMGVRLCETGCTIQRRLRKRLVLAKQTAEEVVRQIDNDEINQLKQRMAKVNEEYNDEIRALLYQIARKEADRNAELKKLREEAEPCGLSCIEILDKLSSYKVKNYDNSKEAYKMYCDDYDQNPGIDPKLPPDVHIDDKQDVHIECNDVCSQYAPHLIHNYN
jgi:hypothetical protein